MNKKFVLLAFASMFLLSALIGAQLIVAVVALRTVGVSEGDWAEYSVNYSGNATMPGMENVTWAKITVQEISGTTNVTFEIRALYANATEETETMVVDVDTGQGNGTSFFTAANLNAGELIYTDPPPDRPEFEDATINETISRTYAIGNVEVNHLNLTTNMTFPGVVNYTWSTNYYWYRTTGMLTEISMYYLLQYVGNMTWFDMEVEIISIIPEFPQAIILPLFMIATLAAVWLGKTIWSAKKLTRKHAPYA